MPEWAFMIIVCAALAAIPISLAVYVIVVLRSRT